LASRHAEEDDYNFKQVPTRSKIRTNSVGNQSQTTLGVQQARTRNIKDYDNSLSRVEFVDNHEIMQGGKLNFPTESDIEHAQVISQLEDPNFLKRLDNNTVDELCAVLDNAKRRQSQVMTSHLRKSSRAQTVNEFDYHKVYPEAVVQSSMRRANNTHDSSFR
jgi:hypothetical protein